MTSYDIGALRRTVAEVEETLPRRLARYVGDDLVGVYLVGSMSGKFDPTAVNDMDILIVPRKYTPRVIYATEKAVKEVCRELQRPEVDLTYSFLKGPVKPTPGQKPSLLLHCLLTERGSLVNPEEDNRLARYSWKLHNRPVYGPNLNSIIRIPRIGLRNVLHDKSGIPAMRRLLKEMRVTSRQVVGDEVLLVEASWEPTQTETVEACLYGVLATAGNALEALHPFIVDVHYESKPDVAREFRHVLKGLKGAGFPEKVWELKEQHRRGELPIDPVFVEELTLETDEFLKNTERALVEMRG